MLHIKIFKQCKKTQTNNSFSPGEHTGQQWFKKFCKGDKSLEDEGSVASLQKLTTPIERIIETDPLTTTQEVAQELSVDHFMVIQHLKQIERVKKLDMWVPYELTANQKNHHFEVSSLILHKNNKPFLRFSSFHEQWKVDFI